MDPSEWEQVGSVQDPDNNGVMVSNLPLLFANGEPSSLQNMTQRQLERFVGFMVHCSVGEDLTKPWSKLPQPSWWPNKLPFKQPTGTTPTPSHRSMLQRLVERCYTYHGCEFLLQFCRSLVQQRPANGYRFSDNRDGTTSMHHSETGKLLVTFRNENRDYDQLSGPTSPTKFGPSSNSAQGRASSRPQLLPRRASSSASIMVRPAAVHDVYLCDRCDGEFATLSEVQAHERECGVTVHAGGPSGTEAASLLRPPPSPEPEPADLPDQDPTNQVAMMHQLGLVPAQHTGLSQYCSPAKSRGLSGAGGKRGAAGKGVHKPPPPTHHFSIRKLSRTNYFRFESVDLSSPLGRIMLKDCTHSNPAVGFNAGGRTATGGAGAGGAGSHLVGSAPSQQLVLRYERHLPATPHVLFPPTRDTSRGLTRWVIVYRNPKLLWYHPYSFSRSQRSERWLTIETGMDCRARTLFHQCQPCSVRLKKVPKRMIDRYTRLGDQSRKASAVCIDLTEDGAAAAFSRSLNSAGVVKAVRKAEVVDEPVAPFVPLVPPTRRVGLSPLEHVLNKANGNQKWVIAPGFLEHVIAGGAVPQNGVALALHRLFSPTGLLVKLVNDAMKSRNFSALVLKEYGSIRPSVDQLNRLLYEQGIFDEIGLKLASSPFMVDFAFNYGPVLNNPDLMTRFTTLPPDIPKVTNSLVSSTLANKEFLTRPQPLEQGGSTPAPSSFNAATASVPRQKPGPKSKRKPLLHFQQTAKAPMVVPEATPSHNMIPQPLLLPPSSFSSCSNSLNNVVNNPKMEELRRLAPKTIPDNELCEKLQKMIRQNLNPEFASAAQNSIFGTSAPLVGGSVITGDTVSAELFKHGPVNDVDEHGIPVIDVIDLSSDEEVDRSTVPPTNDAFTKEGSSVNRTNNSSLSDSNLGVVVGNEGLGDSDVGLNNRLSTINSVQNPNNNHSNRGNATQFLSSLSNGSDGANNTTNLPNQSHSLFVSPSVNNSSIAGSLQAHTSSRNGTKKLTRRKEQESSSEATSSPVCSSNTENLSSKNGRSHWSQSPRSSGLGGRKPGTFRVANGGQPVRSDDLAGDESAQSLLQGGRLNQYSARLGPEDHISVNKNTVVTSSPPINGGVFSTNSFYGDRGSPLTVMNEDEARYASVGALRDGNGTGGCCTAAVNQGTTTRSSHIRIKTSLVPVTVEQPVLKNNNNYLSQTPNNEYGSCQTRYCPPSHECDACRIFDDKRRGKKRILSGYDSEYELDEIIRSASPKRVCRDNNKGKNAKRKPGYQSYSSQTYYRGSGKDPLCVTSEFDEVLSSPCHSNHVVDDEITVRMPVQFTDEEIIFSTNLGDDVIEDPPPLLGSGGLCDQVSSEDCFQGSEEFEVESGLPQPVPLSSYLKNLPVVSAETLLEDCTYSSESCTSQEDRSDDRSQSSRGLLSTVLSKGYNFFRSIVTSSSSSEEPTKSSDQQEVRSSSSNGENIPSALSTNIGDLQESLPVRLERESPSIGLECNSSPETEDDSYSDSNSEAADDARPSRVSFAVQHCLKDECKELTGLKQLMSVNTGRRVTRRALQSLLPAKRTHRNSSQVFRRGRITNRRRQDSKTKFGSKYDQRSLKGNSRRPLPTRNGRLASKNWSSSNGTPNTPADSDSDSDMDRNQSRKKEKTSKMKVQVGNTGIASKPGALSLQSSCSTPRLKKDQFRLLDEISLRLGESLALNLTQGVLFDALTNSIEMHSSQLLNQSSLTTNDSSPSNNPVSTLNTSGYGSFGVTPTKAGPACSVRQSSRDASKGVCYSDSRKWTPRSPGIMDSIKKKGAKSRESSDNEFNLVAPEPVHPWVRPAWIMDSAGGGSDTPGSDSNSSNSPQFNSRRREFRNYGVVGVPSKLAMENQRKDITPQKLGPSSTSSAKVDVEKSVRPQSVPTSSDDDSSTNTDMSSDREISFKELKRIPAPVASLHSSNLTRLPSDNKRSHNASSSSSSDEACSQRRDPGIVHSAPVCSRRKRKLVNKISKATSDSEWDYTPLIQRLTSRKRLHFRTSALDKISGSRRRIRKLREFPIRPTFKIRRKRSKSVNTNISQLLKRRTLASLARDEFKELRTAGCHPEDIIIDSCEESSSSNSDEDVEISLQKRPMQQLEQRTQDVQKLTKEVTDTGQSGTSEDVLAIGLKPTGDESSKNIIQPRRRGSFELKRLAKDEFKEMRKTGFHPKDVIYKELRINNLHKRVSLSTQPRSKKPVEAPSNAVINNNNNNNATDSLSSSTQVSCSPRLGGNVASVSPAVRDNVATVSSSESRPVKHVVRKVSGRGPGWLNLMAIVNDECKEFRNSGLHPVDAYNNQLSNSMVTVAEGEAEKKMLPRRRDCNVTYTEVDTDDEDSDTESHSLKRRKKKKNVSSSNHVATDERHKDGTHGSIDKIVDSQARRKKPVKKYGKRELNNLMRDEIKEFRTTGFHPGDIVNTINTGERSDSSSSEDSCDERHKPTAPRLPSVDLSEARKEKQNAQGYETDTEDFKPLSPSKAAKKSKKFKELKNLLADECKELKSRRNAMRELGRSRIEGLRRKLVVQCHPRTHSSSKRSQRSEPTSGRTQRTVSGQGKRGSAPEMMVRTVRNHQRDILRVEGAMCVINYRLPEIS